MHELSIAESLIDIIKQEMKKNNVTKLNKVKIVYGQITAIVPEALQTAFEVLTSGTEFENSVIESEQNPLRVRCCKCQYEFCPDEIYVMPCPECGEEFGHEMLAGKELYIEYIEAE